jgi:glyoxylase-like metal-dependent hydrolase (beta-lactamase superfamily II)
MNRLRTVVLLLGFASLAGCSRNLDRVAQPPVSTVVTTAGPNHSMIYLARVDGGVVAVDLGWWGAGRALERGLARLDADTSDVVAVFLTHSHRDHIAGWPHVRDATFHLATAEVPRFTGLEEHEGWIARTADDVVDAHLPAPDELTLRSFSSDTTFTFGDDTVHAFVMPGHTSGSAAYLIRGVLFLGDAASRRPFQGYVSAKYGYSDDTERSRRELAALFERIEPLDVRWACTAHGDCAPYDATFRADVLGIDSDDDQP